PSGTDGAGSQLHADDLTLRVVVDRQRLLPSGLTGRCALCGGCNPDPRGCDHVDLEAAGCGRPTTTTHGGAPRPEHGVHAAIPLVDEDVRRAAGIGALQVEVCLCAGWCAVHHRTERGAVVG